MLNLEDEKTNSSELMTLVEVVVLMTYYFAGSHVEWGSNFICWMRHNGRT